MKEKKNTHLKLFLAVGTALAVGTMLVVRKQVNAVIRECSRNSESTKDSRDFRLLRMEDIEGTDSILNCELGLSCNSSERHCPGLARCGLVECCGFGFDIEEDIHIPQKSMAPLNGDKEV